MNYHYLFKLKAIKLLLSILYTYIRFSNYEL